MGLGLTLSHINTLLIIGLIVYVAIRLERIMNLIGQSSNWLKLAKEYLESAQSKEAAGKRVLMDVRLESEELHKTAEKVKDTVSKVVETAGAQMQAAIKQAEKIGDKVDQVPPKVVDLLEAKESGILRKPSGL